MQDDEDKPPVWVEIEATDPQISGRVHRSGSEAEPFAGWLELLSVLSPD